MMAYIFKDRFWQRAVQGFSLTATDSMSGYFVGYFIGAATIRI